MDKESKIYIAGHNGLLGSAIVRALKVGRYTNLILKSRKELDLCNQSSVNDFFSKTHPEYVFIAAAKVGGILANSDYPADFIYENLVIQTNIIHAAHKAGVKKLLFLGSTCIYPKLTKQPIEENSLLSGPLEETNEWYAVAKIAGIKLCQAYAKQYGSNFISAMPTNLYGPGDNFDLETSHVLPALMRKFHDAKINNKSNVTLWGTGFPRRELLYVDDCAEACLHLMKNEIEYDITNIGTGEDLSIAELAQIIKEIVGFDGNIIYDSSKPDGAPQKLTNVSRIASSGWSSRVTLQEGIRATYHWYIENMDSC